LIHLPGSRKIACSGDVSFDKTFYSAVANTWRCFEVGIALRPTSQLIPGPDMALEETGDITNVHHNVDDFVDTHVDIEEDIPVTPHIVDDGQPNNPQPQRA
jgi:hypothetical protein